MQGKTDALWKDLSHIGAISEKLQFQIDLEIKVVTKIENSGIIPPTSSLQMNDIKICCTSSENFEESQERVPAQMVEIPCCN